MAKKSKAWENLAAYGRDLLDDADVESLAIELEGQSDRAFAIIMGTATEHALAFAIKARLRPGEEHGGLFEGPNSPFGNFSNKIAVGYALEIYGSKTRHDLDHIRHLRNTAAHSKRPISFEAPEVKGFCALINVADTFRGGSTREHPRDWFFQCCRLLIDALSASGYGKITPSQQQRLS